MEFIESLLRLAVSVLALAGGLAPEPVAATAAPLPPAALASTGTAESSGLVGGMRWQQTEEVPSDLPDADAASAAPPIERTAPDIDEPLDAPPADEPLDAVPDTALAQDEPLDAPTAAVAAPEPAAADDHSAPAAAPVAAAPAAKPDSKRTFALPADFGRGVTIVRNPAGGTAAEVPTDCKQLLEHGRAVIGIGCGDDDGPWWLSEVGHLAPAMQAPAAGRTTTVPPARQDRSAVVSPAAANRSTRDGEVIGQSTVTVNGETTRVPNVSNVERITIDRSGGRAVESERGGDGGRANAQSRGGRVSGLNQVTSTQPANKNKAKPNSAKKANGKKANACAVAKQKAKAGASKKQMAKLRAQCKQQKKANGQPRA